MLPTRNAYLVAFAAWSVTGSARLLNTEGVRGDVGGSFVEVSVGSLQDAPLDSLARVVPDKEAVLLATRAAGIGPAHDELRVRTVGKVGQILVQDPSDNTVLMAFPSVGDVKSSLNDQVWLPIKSLLTRKGGDAKKGDEAKKGDDAPKIEARKKPEYPLDPLLDIDYLYNDDQGHSNYLEDFVNTTELSDRLVARYEVETDVNATSNSTSNSTSNTSQNASSAAPVEPAVTSTAAVNTTLMPVVLVKGCVTRSDAREQKSGFLLRVKSAPHGTPCMFGLASQDEDKHCIFDEGKFGSSGWCYTKRDRSEWGSCSDGCPLEGDNLQLGRRIDKLTQQVYLALARANGK